jgi:hypothetical protein
MLRSRDKAIIVSSIVSLILSLMDGALTIWGLGQGATKEMLIILIWLIFFF